MHPTHSVLGLLLRLQARITALGQSGFVRVRLWAERRYAPDHAPRFMRGDTRQVVHGELWVRYITFQMAKRSSQGPGRQSCAHRSVPVYLMPTRAEERRVV